LIPEACSKAGAAFKYDLSTSPGEMYDLVLEMREKLAKDKLLQPDQKGQVKMVCGFGHMGDGNLHLNIIAKDFTEEVRASIEPHVYQLVANKGGSISAEHGLGAMKAPYLSYSKSPESIELMRTIKKTFDPKGLLNPYKYIL